MAALDPEGSTHVITVPTAQLQGVLQQMRAQGWQIAQIENQPIEYQAAPQPVPQPIYVPPVSRGVDRGGPDGGPASVPPVYGPYYRPEMGTPPDITPQDLSGTWHRDPNGHLITPSGIDLTKFFRFIPIGGGDVQWVRTTVPAVGGAIGEYVVSAAEDGQVVVQNTRDGTMIRTSWEHAGDSGVER